MMIVTPSSGTGPSRKRLIMNQLKVCFIVILFHFLSIAKIWPMSFIDTDVGLGDEATPHRKEKSKDYRDCNLLHARMEILSRKNSQPFKSAKYTCSGFLLSALENFPMALSKQMNFDPTSHVCHNIICLGSTIGDICSNCKQLKVEVANTICIISYILNIYIYILIGMYLCV